jgi:hypothetical protein
MKRYRWIVAAGAWAGLVASCDAIVGVHSLDDTNGDAGVVLDATARPDAPAPLDGADDAPAIPADAPDETGTDDTGSGLDTGNDVTVDSQENDSSGDDGVSSDSEAGTPETGAPTDAGGGTANDAEGGKDAAEGGPDHAKDAGGDGGPADAGQDADAD